MRKHLTKQGARWYGQQSILTACGKRVSAHDARPDGPISCPECQAIARTELANAKAIAKTSPHIWQTIGQCGVY